MTLCIIIVCSLSTIRGNPEYKDVASMPYKTECLEGIATNETDLHTLGESTSDYVLERPSKQQVQRDL